MGDGKVISIDTVYALARERNSANAGRCTSGEIDTCSGKNEEDFSYLCKNTEQVKLFVMADGHSREGLEKILSKETEQNAILLRCTRDHLLKNPQYAAEQARKIGLDAAKFGYAIAVSPTQFPQLPVTRIEDEPLFRYRHEMSLLTYEFYVANAAFLKDHVVRKGMMPIDKRHAGEAAWFAASKPEYEWLDVSTRQKSQRLKQQYLKKLQPGFFAMLTNRYSDREIKLAAQEVVLDTEEEFARDGSYMNFLTQCTGYTDWNLRQVMSGESDEHRPIRLVNGLPAEEKTRNNKRLKLVK